MSGYAPMRLCLVSPVIRTLVPWPLAKLENAMLQFTALPRRSVAHAVTDFLGSAPSSARNVRGVPANLADSRDRAIGFRSPGDVGGLPRRHAEALQRPMPHGSRC